MRAVKTIGLNIARSVFQVHGVDVDGQVVIRSKLKRRCAGFLSEGAAVPRRYRIATLNLWGGLKLFNF
jgi:hypothetical protein